MNNTEGNDIILQFMKENERRSSETLEKITSSLASSLKSFSKNIADNFKKLNEKIEHCKVDNADNSAPKALPAAEDNLHNTENSVATSSRDHEERTGTELSYDGSDLRTLINRQKRKIAVALRKGHDTVSVAEFNNLDGFLEKMLNPSESKRSKTEKLAEQTGDTEQELWADVMEEYEKDEELGKEIIPPLRSTAKVMWLKKLDADKLKNKLQATKFPENCKFMKVKQCNKFIWSLAKCRSEDIKVQAIQQSLVKS